MYFQVYYIDIEACSMSIYGPEELKYPNRSLFSFNIVDGDEFEIDLKPPPVIHSASDNQFQHTTSQYQIHCHDSNSSSSNSSSSSNCVTKPINIRNRKVSENSLSGESVRESTSFTRVTKKPKPISFFSGHSITKSSSKKNNNNSEPIVGDFCSLPSSLNKKNRLASIEANEDIGSEDTTGNQVVFTGGQEIDDEK